jgi:hypothetical protein
MKVRICRQHGVTLPVDCRGVGGRGASVAARDRDVSKERAGILVSQSQHSRTNGKSSPRLQSACTCLTGEDTSWAHTRCGSGLSAGLAGSAKQLQTNVPWRHSTFSTDYELDVQDAMRSVHKVAFSVARWPCFSPCVMVTQHPATASPDCPAWKL